MKTAKLFRKALAVVLALVLAAIPFSHLSANAEKVASVDMHGATVITFAESGITVTPGEYAGYSVEGNEVKIDEAGTYLLKGESLNASVKVKRETTGVVLVLGGLNLTSETTAPITCAKSTEVTIIAAADTVNTLSDTELNNDETHADNLDAENAVIKCNDGSKVVIAGEGTLNIIANGRNGVKGGASTEAEGESSLTVRELTLNIKANVNDALKSDTLLKVESGNITIEAADDAIKSDYVLNIGTPDGEEPNINIVSSNEGIEAATLNVYSGNITVNSTDDGINAANSNLADYSFECNFYGGKVVINTTIGDGIDSNGSINFAGGELEVHSSTRSDNSPFDADGSITLSGGTVFGIGMPGMGSLPSSATQNYVYFGSGGMGFGGRGGFPGLGGNGQPPMGGNGTPPEPPNDGGMMHPPMGENGTPPEPPNDGGMMHPPTGESGTPPEPPNDGGMGDFHEPGGFGAEQSGSRVSIAEGDEVSIVDASGNTVYSVTAKRSASFVFLSTDAMVEGETYTLVVNGTEIAAAQAGVAASTPMGGFGRGNMDEANGGSLVATSKGESSADDFAKMIMLVLAAVGLVAIGCVTTIIIMNSRSRKKLASSENGDR